MQKRRLFGTSGVRGVVNQDLTPDLCRQVALAIGTTLPLTSRVCIATDTRISRELIKEAVTSGLLSCSINVVDLGILPTPALALLTRELGFAAGIMVTASHNPPEFNGIKLFTDNSMGYSQAQEEEIERVYFEQKFRQGKKGTLEQAQDMKQKYLSFIKGKLNTQGFNHRLKVVVDPGNGAASQFASYILVQMGLDVIPEEK
jgi:phosphomannomutase